MMVDSMADRTDIELVQAWRVGDDDAGSELVERHFSSVFRFLRRRVTQAEQARDLAQATFETCVEICERVESGVRFRAFLLGIARNLLLRHRRAQAQQQRRDADADGAGLLSPRTSPSGAVAVREEQRLLLAALRRLPQDLQVTLELHYWEELTTAEIATVLGVARGTIKWRLASARERLRTELENMAHVDLVESTVRDLDRWARSVRKLVDSDFNPQG